MITAIQNTISFALLVALLLCTALATVLYAGWVAISERLRGRR